MSSISSSGLSFAGLASGTDTESMVKAMLGNYQLKYDTAQKEQLLLELKLEKYKEVNSQVVNFYDTNLRSMRMQSTFTATNTTISDHFSFLVLSCVSCMYVFVVAASLPDFPYHKGQNVCLLIVRQNKFALKRY